MKENRVEEQWDLDPIDESINALIRSARSESDMPRNAKIFVDVADEINLDYVSAETFGPFTSASHVENID